MYANAVPFKLSAHGHSASFGGGPPPAKKPKGNPIITRYPLPPGYKLPVQPPTATYGRPPAWQNQNHAQPAYSGSQQQIYTNPQTPQPQFQFQHAAPTSVAQPHSYHPGQSAHSSSSRAWPPPTQHTIHGRHHSVPSIPSVVSRIALDGNGEPFSPLEPGDSLTDALEHEFDEECYYARHPEQIDPSLSLGSIVWKAPMPAKSALPPTFEEAELEVIAPLAVTKASGESVSAFCNGEEALLSIRQTEAWFDLKDSLIFREFPKVCQKLISLSELLADYRDRFDAQWAAGSRPPTPGLTREPTPARSDSRASNCSQRMELDQHEEAVRQSTEHSAAFDNQLDVLNDLEAALRPGSRNGSVSHSRAGSVAHSRAGSAAHSRAGSVTHSRPGSVYSHHRRPSSAARFRALPTVRDSAQDDILAALGVSGSPKMVYLTPGPAFGPPPTMVDVGKGRHSRQSSVASAHSIQHMPHPTIPEETDAVNAVVSRFTDGHTADCFQVLECDREPDDNATPRPQRWQRDNMRKRSYADSQAGAQQQQQDEETPKRSKPFRVGQTAR